MSTKKMDAGQKLKVLKTKRHEPAKYKNSSHMVNVFQSLQKLRNDEVLCDVRIETNFGKTVFGHKIVFISASPYFRAMFTCVAEGKKGYVERLRELDSKVLQLLVDYMYTGEITITKENVKIVLPAANLVQLDYVKRACVGFLQKHLNPSNCLGIKSFADLYNYKELLLISEEFIKKQFLEVVEYQEFLFLSSKEVIKLISSDDISIPLEEKVYECVINWVRYRLNSRKDFLPDLMEHVRLPLVSKEYILEKVVDEPLLKSNPKCKDYVFEALHFNLMKSVHPFSIPQTIRSKPRQSTSLQKVVLVLSLSSSANKLITNWYDPAINLLTAAPELSKFHVAGGLSVIKDQFVFAVGGAQVPHLNVHIDFNAKSSRSVEMLDVSSQLPCWVSKVELLVNRKYFGIGAIDNCIYAVGGYNDANNYYEHLNSVEVFDINTQQWRRVSSMSSKRSHFGVGILNNLLYAVGGYNGSSYLKSVECYDPSLDKWNAVAEMSVCRYEVSVGVLNGVMYAIGGTNGSLTQKTVQAYTTSAGVWKSIPDMHLSRKNAGVFALDGLLYVMGGTNGNNPVDSIEMYNPLTNSWSIKTLSTIHLLIYDAVVVNKPPHLRTN